MKLKLVFSYILLLFILTTGCRPNQTRKSENPPEATNYWKITSTTDIAKNAGLLNVESIVYDPSNQVLYASNGKDYKPSVSGFISKISLDGEVEALKWVSNLSRPTGMALWDSILYVADVNSLVAINTKTGDVISKYKEPINHSGLNDVTIDKNGVVYVSASFVHSIFKLNKDVFEPWKTDSEMLQWANGLCANSDKIIVGGTRLSQISTGSGTIDFLESSGIVDFDGIEPDDFGGYFLTTVENSRLFHMNAKGDTTKVMEGDDYFGDLEFVPSLKKIYVPRGNHKTKEYFLTVIDLQKE